MANLALVALRAAVFSLSAKSLRGGGLISAPAAVRGLKMLSEDNQTKRRTRVGMHVCTYLFSYLLFEYLNLIKLKAIDKKVLNFLEVVEHAT